MEAKKIQESKTNNRANDGKVLKSVKAGPNLKKMDKTPEIKRSAEMAKQKGRMEEKRRIQQQKADTAARSDKKQSNGISPDKSATISSVLGDVCWLLSQSPAHRYNFFLADLEWMVFPPVMLGQYKFFQMENRPFGFAVWASVSDEVEKRLEKGLGKLTSAEWKSGNHLWLIDVIAPYGQVDKILNDLKTTVFSDKAFKFQRTNAEGKREVVAVQPESKSE